MKSRSSRVYVLLAILSVIMFCSLIADITVDKTSEHINKNITSENTENNNINNIENTSQTEDSTETTTALVLTSAQELTVSNFYKNTVFVGDSIMSGFATYSSTKEAPEFIKNIIYLSARSYGVDAAINNKGIIYKGESRPLIENLELIKPEKIFINLGVNELDGVPAEKVGKKYEELIKNIKASLPDSQIFVMGVTYFVEGKETLTYNNGGIKEFNNYLKSHSSSWGVTYLDLASKLSNEKGYLPAEYASDNRIHHNNTAYGVWVEFLEEIALNYNE